MASPDSGKILWYNSDNLEFIDFAVSGNTYELRLIIRINMVYYFCTFNFQCGTYCTIHGIWWILFDYKIIVISKHSRRFPWTLVSWYIFFSETYCTTCDNKLLFYNIIWLFIIPVCHNLVESGTWNKTKVLSHR